MTELQGRRVDTGDVQRLDRVGLEDLQMPSCDVRVWLICGGEGGRTMFGMPWPGNKRPAKIWQMVLLMAVWKAWRDVSRRS